MHHLSLIVRHHEPNFAFGMQHVQLFVHLTEVQLEDKSQMHIIGFSVQIKMFIRMTIMQIYSLKCFSCIPERIATYSKETLVYWFTFNEEKAILIVYLYLALKMGVTVFLLTVLDWG